LRRGWEEEKAKGERNGNEKEVKGKRSEVREKVGS